MSACQVIIIPANTFRELPCKLRSNLAVRKWEFSKTPGHFHYPSPEGGLVVVAQADRQENYECWSVEEGFKQLLANYCVRGQARQESTTFTGRSHMPPISQEEFIILPGEARSPHMNTKTYWNELLVVCALLAFSLVVFSLFVVYRNRSHMKSMLKEGECPTMQQKKPRTVGKPVENLPLNGNAVTASVSDHKGYQTLNDNYICSTPPQECSSPDNSKSFSESEKRPLNLRESHVEISPTCPRPRVRLGSMIKDSIVWDLFMLRDGGERVHLLKQNSISWKAKWTSDSLWRHSSLHTFCTLSFTFQFFPTCLVLMLFKSWQPPPTTTPQKTLFSSAFKAWWRGSGLPSDFMFSRTPHGNVTSREVVSTVIHCFSFTLSVHVKYTSNSWKCKALRHMLSPMAGVTFKYSLCVLAQSLPVTEVRITLTK